MRGEKGLFITFEGADGAGKTTQSRLLSEYLSECGYEVLSTREPGGTMTGERVRSLLLDAKCDMGERAETLLYLAVRAEHVDKVVVPALAAGKVVISDRFSDSTFVYQGIARGVGLEKIFMLNDFAAGGMVPDVTFVLDADPKVLQRRMDKRDTRDRIELEGLAFQELVRDGFLQLAKMYPERIVMLDALREAEEIQQDIRHKIRKRFFCKDGKIPKEENR